MPLHGRAPAPSGPWTGKITTRQGKPWEIAAQTRAAQAGRRARPDMAGHSLPPLKALRVFEAAARLRSFTAAADELSITHSAVSQQIRILEDHVGSPVRARGARRGAAALRPGLFPGSAGQPGAHRRRHRQAARTGIYRHAAGLRHAVADHEVADSALVRLPGAASGHRCSADHAGPFFPGPGRRRRQRRAAAPWLHGARRAELRALPGRFPCAGGIAALHRAQPAGRAGRLSGPSAAEGRGRHGLLAALVRAGQGRRARAIAGRCSTITSSACRPP